MSNDEIAQAAQGAPALREIFVISIPDCLLVRHWSREGKRDAETRAVHLGSAFRNAQDASTLPDEATSLSMVTIESDHGIVMLAELNGELTGAFCFDLSAPLGLVRVQTRQLAEHLRSCADRIVGRNLRDYLTPMNRDLQPPPVGTPAPENMAPIHVPPPAIAPVPASPPTEPDSPVESLEGPVPDIDAFEDESDEDPDIEIERAIEQIEMDVDIDALPVLAGDELTPVPAPETPSARSVPPDAAPDAPVSSDEPAAVTEEAPAPPPRPRGARLLDFFRRYAPDPHASFLRLSLRTGIPLEDLEHPERLSDDQVDKLAASVRDILGQEQMTI